MRKAKLPAEERRRNILDNARKVFARHGFKGARTREIAEACGINEAVLYKHFESKEQLFMEVMKGIHDQIKSIAYTRVDPDLNGLESVRSVISWLWKDFATDIDCVANVMHAIALSMEDKDLRDLIGDRFAGHVDYLIRAIEQGRKDGSIRKDADPSHYASMILSLGYAYSVFHAIGILDSFRTPDPLTVFDRILDCLDAGSEG